MQGFCIFLVCSYNQSFALIAPFPPTIVSQFKSAFNLPLLWLKKVLNSSVGIVLNKPPTSKGFLVANFDKTAVFQH